MTLQGDQPQDNQALHLNAYNFARSSLRLSAGKIGLYISQTGRSFNKSQ
jgi:hypothetical protein